MKATKAPDRVQYPVGMVKDGRIKTLNPATGQPEWKAIPHDSAPPTSVAHQPGVNAAKKAGMKTPEDPDNGYDKEKYPHFFIYCMVQLCRRIRWGEHWDNAVVVAKIKEEKLKTITLEQLIAMGLEYST